MLAVEWAMFVLTAILAAQTIYQIIIGEAHVGHWLYLGLLLFVAHFVITGILILSRRRHDG